MRSSPLSCVGVLLASAMMPYAAVAQQLVRPSDTNPQVRQYDDPSIVLSGGPASRNAPLVIFMPGTGGTSESPPRLLLNTIAGQGYRVIYLTYNNEPAVS